MASFMVYVIFSFLCLLSCTLNDIFFLPDVTIDLLLAIAGTGTPGFTVLNKCWAFYKLQARPFTGSKITTHFFVVVWN